MGAVTTTPATDWLQRYVEAGGGYVVRPDGGVSFAYAVDQRSDEDNRAIRSMLDQLSDERLRWGVYAGDRSPA